MKKKKKSITIILILGFIFLFLITSFFIYKSKLILNGEKEEIVAIGEEYKDQGAYLSLYGIKMPKIIYGTHQIDTNISGDYIVSYEINTIFGKRVKANRIVHVKDLTAPTLELFGDNDINLFLGEPFKEPGYQASDDIDGDLSSQVTTSGVDFNRVGSYKMVYEVKDNSGNTTMHSRNINILKRQDGHVDSSLRLSILMYHFFYDQSVGESGADNNFIEISNFRSQMAYLIEEDYYFPTWQEVRDFCDGLLLLPEKSIVVTADDGNESFFRLAVPVLSDLNIPVTSFIVTSWTGKDTVENSNYDSINFESHTHNMHRGGSSKGHGGIIFALSNEEVVNDLLTSIEITGHTGALAYPFGDYDEVTMQCVDEAGFLVAVTTEYGHVYPGMNPLKLPRIRVNGSTSLQAFKNMLK